MLLTLMWICVGVGMFMIVSAAIKAGSQTVCKGYTIDIFGFGENKLFTSETDIAKLIEAASGGAVKGKNITSFDLPKMEDLLEQSAWVYNAELYFDNNDILHVKVTERKPLARVFTREGRSFYIDEAGKHIPLSEKISLDVPVFTGYPNKQKMNGTDSTLLQNMIATASFIGGDRFWTSQVAEINITNCGADCYTMVMTPVVGNHKVVLGDGNDIASKFHRLYIFYDQVLKKKGFDKYQKIDVQYNGQIIGMRDSLSRVDSIQLRKNIEGLLLQARQANDVIEKATVTGATPFVIPDTVMQINQPFQSIEEDTVTTAAVTVKDVNETVTKPAKAATLQPKAVTAEKPVEKKIVDVKKPVVKKPQAIHTAKPVANSKAQSNKAVIKKPDVKSNVKKADKTEDKKAVTKKPDVKKAAVKKTEAKKPEAKKETVKPAVKKPVADVKKPVTKKTEPVTKKTTKNN